jgi:plasmid stability protein
MSVDEYTEYDTLLTLRLDARLVAELARRAKENERSVSAEARQALRDWLRPDDEPIAEASA